MWRHNNFVPRPRDNQFGQLMIFYQKYSNSPNEINPDLAKGQKGDPKEMIDQIWSNKEHFGLAEEKFIVSTSSKLKTGYHSAVTKLMKLKINFSENHQPGQTKVWISSTYIKPNRNLNTK